MPSSGVSCKKNEALNYSSFIFKSGQHCMPDNWSNDLKSYHNRGEEERTPEEEPVQAFNQKMNRFWKDSIQLHAEKI